jgi:hypothetical protein
MLLVSGKSKRWFTLLKHFRASLWETLLVIAPYTPADGWAHHDPAAPLGRSFN